MALDGGGCLTDLPGLPLLRRLEAVWLYGTGANVFVMFAALAICVIYQWAGAILVIFYAGLYFVIFAPNRTLLKVFVLLFLLTIAGEALLEQVKPGWRPTFTITRSRH
jgi:hypothetical protein